MTLPPKVGREAAYAAPPFFAALFGSVFTLGVGFDLLFWVSAFGAHFTAFGFGWFFGRTDTAYRAAALTSGSCGGRGSSENPDGSSANSASIRTSCASVALFALWFVALVASSAAIGLTGIQIKDDIESGLPIQQRPSWRLLQVHRFPWTEFQQHRRLYPASRLRRWLVALIVLQSGSLGLNDLRGCEDRELVRIRETDGLVSNVLELLLDSRAEKHGGGYKKIRVLDTRTNGFAILSLHHTMPQTAASAPVKVPNVSTEEDNIHVGVRLIHFLVNDYFDQPDFGQLNRTLFEIASYNAGPAKIAKCWQLAQDMGYDPNKWFGNVEVATAKLVGR